MNDFYKFPDDSVGADDIRRNSWYYTEQEEKLRDMFYDMKHGEDNE